MKPRVLVIGGNRFMGARLVWRLMFAGHQVTILNRGRAGDPFGARVERLVADRSTDEFDRVLAGRAFDWVIDFAGFTGPDLSRAVRVLDGRIGRYAFISTGQVYLVREGCPLPAREGDFEGPVMARPPTPAEEDDWRYGIDKRGAEVALREAAFGTVTLRIPMVHGEGDPKRRFEKYLARLLDGGPLLVPRGEAIARHVFADSVVDCLVRFLERPPSEQHAIFNLAQRETVSVRALVTAIAQAAGATPRIVDVDAALMEAQGLSVRDASPFSNRWMSLIEPAKAETELNFVHPPLERVIERIVGSLLANWPTEPLPGLEQRPQELALAARLSS